MNRSLITNFIASAALFVCTASCVSAAVDLKGYDGRPTANPTYFFDVQQTSAKWGEVIGIKFAVINTGTTASGTFSVRLFFSKNTTFGDADDVTFVTVPGFTSLGQNQLTGYSSYANVSLPASNPYGDFSTVFYIGMMVDPANAIAESNETNNRNVADGTDKDGTPITITGPAPKIQLATSGSTLPPAASLAMDFGNLAADGLGGATLTQTVQLTNTGDLSLTATGIAVSGAGFSLKDITSNVQTLTQPVTYPRAITALGQETWLINVLFDPTTTGSRTGALVVSSNDATRPSVSISLTGNGVAVPQMIVGYSAPSGTDTRSMDFGTVINDGTGAANAERTITLTNSGSGPLTVSQNGLSLINGTGWQIVSTTSSTQGSINLTSTAKTIAASGAETWSIVVRFDPASIGAFSGGLQILSNDPNSPSYALALSGTDVVPMMLETKDSIGADSDRAMNFGAVHADGAGLQQAMGSVTLKNTGGAPLFISQNGIALVDGTHFKILSISSNTQPGLNLTTGTATLAAGGTEIWSVNLACDPTAAGALATQLRILSNDPSQGTVTIALSGTGLNQPGIEAADSSGAAGDRAIAFGPTLNDGAGNRTRSHSVTLKNIGVQPLVISQNGVTIINGTKFSVQNIVSSTRGAITISSATAAARTIAPLGAEIWTITTVFDPDANSAFTGTLRISSNDPLLPTLDHSLSGSGVQPAIALDPTTPGSTLFISASQPHSITWSATYTGGDARISLYRDTDTNPANGNTLIVANLLQSAGSRYDWTPDVALAGQEFYLYATIEDGTVKSGSYAARKIRIDAVGAFQLISAVQSASADYAWQYE